MSPAPVRLKSKSPPWFHDLPDKLSAALEDYDLPSTSDWNPLDELSTQTQFEGIEVSGDASVIDSGRYVAPGTVYVALNYGKGEDHTSFYDSYPARVFFSIDDENITVEHVEVDTSSFYK